MDGPAKAGPVGSTHLQEAVSGLLPAHRIEAPRSPASAGQIKTGKAEHDRQAAIVQHWKKAARKMLDEIGECHFAAQDKGNRPRQQTEDQEPAKDQFEHAGDTEKR